MMCVSTIIAVEYSVLKEISLLISWSVKLSKETVRIDINRLISAFLDLKAEIMLTSLDVGNYGNGLLNLIINKYTELIIVNYILFNRAFENRWKECQIKHSTKQCVFTKYWDKRWNGQQLKWVSNTLRKL